MDRINGTVTRTFPRKGYFWVHGDDSNEYFVHISEVQNQESLKEIDKTYNDDEDGSIIHEAFVTARTGQRCSFEPTRGKKGLAAVSVVMDVVG